MSVESHFIENFESIYEENKTRVYNTAYRMLSNPADAEDVTQDVFVRAYKKMDQFRGDASIGTWLYRITINLCLDRLRKKRYDVLPLNEAIALQSEKPSLRAHLEHAMSFLPGGYKAVFVLHEIEGLNHREISNVLGISEGTSKSQLHKARNLLRRKLSPYLKEIR